MKKVLTLIGLVALVLGLVTVFLPFATGIEMSADGTVESIAAYNFVFGSKYDRFAREPNGAMIAAFSLNLIAILFCLLGFVFLVPEGTKKFGSFLLFVGGGCALATGIIYILAKQILNLEAMIEIKNATFALKFGFIGAGIGGLAAGALGLAGGFLGMASKK